MAINTIIFDFGGVLVDWSPTYYYRDVFNDDEKMNWFLDNICTNEWNMEHDRGRPFAEGLKILKDKHSGYDELIDAYYHKWEVMLKGEISGSVDILHALKKNYKVYGLTNWSSETFPIALERFDFFSLLDGIVVSGDEKLVKPEKEIFHLLLERYNLRVENCVFIDDNLDNINSAREIGFHSIHFKTPEDLRNQLKLLNVVI